MKAESQMKAAKTKKNLKEMPYSPLKNFLKRKENNILEKKSIILESDQRNILPFLRLFWEEQQKYLQSSQNKDTYHSMNPNSDVTYQTVNLFGSDKCLIFLVSDVPHYIWWNQNNTSYTSLVKVEY